MIAVNDLVSGLQAALDAEGSGYFNFNRDYRPAINYAKDWIVGIVSPLIGTKKFPEESFRELSATKIWQTNKFSGVVLDPADIGGMDYWTILAVIPKPKVVLLDAPNLTVVLPGQYYTEIQPFLGQEVINGPKVTQAWNATGLTQLEPQQSTFRPELAFVDGNNMASRLTLDEWAKRSNNIFNAGYLSQVSKYVQWAYLNASDYTSTIGGYTLSVPREIKISPDVSRDLVAITYIQTPADVVLQTDTIAFPQTMYTAVLQKALSYIAIKENKGAQLYNISSQEVLQALNVL